MFVQDAHIADYILCPVKTSQNDKDEENISLVLIDPKSEGVTCTPLKDTISKDKLFRLDFENVTVSLQNLITNIHEGWPLIKKLINHGAIGECAKMVGGGKKVLDLSVKYAKNRKQYDRPIGSFQIIQHYLSNMFTDVEANRLITYQAAWKMSQGMDSEKDVSMAKAWVNDAYYRICVNGHQVHGGVGFTEEFDVGLYFRRAKAQEISFGDADFHCDIVAQKMGLPEC